MKVFFIIHEPGKCPRVGHPLDDPKRLDEAVRNWQRVNPTAEVYVVQCSSEDLSPGTIWAETAREWIARLDLEQSLSGRGDA